MTQKEKPASLASCVMRVFCCANGAFGERGAAGGEGD